MYQYILKVIKLFIAHNRLIDKFPTTAVRAFGNCLSGALEFALENNQETKIISDKKKARIMPVIIGNYL